MLRILHVVGSMNRGGIETFIMNIYRTIDRKKIQFDFLVHINEKGAYDDEIINMGGKIFNITPRKEGYYKNIRSLEIFFKNHNYQVVHQHLSSLTYIEPLRIATKYKVPNRIVHSHSTQQSGSFIHTYLHMFQKLFIKKYATKFFSCSKPAAFWAFPKKIIDQENYTIINNGIKSEDFKFNQESRNEIRRKLNIKSTDFVIGHVGRFHPLKNQKFLLKVFKELNLVKENTYLLFIGSGKLEEDLREMSKNMNLIDNVKFLGEKKNVNNYYLAMDYFVFPSKFEGLGMALVEAQTSGLKCLTTKDKVPEEVNLTGLVKYVHLNDGPKKWAKIIMDDFPYSRRDRVEKIKNMDYDVTTVAQKLENHYKDLKDK